MAAMDFPPAPTVGDLYPDPPTVGVPQYRWDGGAWLAVSTPEDLSYVRRTGDTMTGLLTLSGNPTVDLHAVPRQYAVAKAGDTMTGFLTLHADPDAALKAATKQYVDNSDYPRSGYLKVNSTTQIGFYPKNGDLVKIYGSLFRIPSTGVLAANTNVMVNGVAGQSLASLTTYLVVLFQVGGIPTIAFWSLPTYGRATDMTTPNNIGVEVINGAPAHSVIGMIRTGTGLEFVDTLANRHCISWFNRVSKLGSGAAGGSTASVATVPIAVGCTALNWAEDHVEAWMVGQAVITGGTFGFVAVGYDGTTAHAQNTFTYMSTNPDAYACGGSDMRTDGYHYYQSIGGASSGTGTLSLYNTAIRVVTRG